MRALLILAAAAALTACAPQKPMVPQGVEIIRTDCHGTDDLWIDRAGHYWLGWRGDFTGDLYLRPISPQAKLSDICQ